MVVAGRWRVRGVNNGGQFVSRCGRWFAKCGLRTQVVLRFFTRGNGRSSRDRSELDGDQHAGHGDRRIQTRTGLSAHASYKDNLLIWGSESVEFWGGLNDTGFRSPSSQPWIGIVGPYTRSAATRTASTQASILSRVISRFQPHRRLRPPGHPAPILRAAYFLSRGQDGNHGRLLCQSGRPVVVISSPTWT